MGVAQEDTASLDYSSFQSKTREFFDSPHSRRRDPVGISHEVVVVALPPN